MLRPDMVITYAKERGAGRLSDFNQLMDGVNVGGRIVVGGGPPNSMRLRSLMTQSQRLGMVLSVQEIRDPKLDPFVTYTFDQFAIAQLLMIAKNEAFHATVDQCINLLQENCVDGDQPLVVGLQLLREQADKIDHL